MLVHDGDATFDGAVRVIASRAGVQATVERAEPGLTLGELRNRTVALARGELVAQWDDDDRQHPERLARAAAALAREDADFAFLVDQLHWFEAEGTLTWDDWSVEAYPLDFVQGTLVGRRDRMPAYAASRRGEDTTLCLDLLAAGARIARIRDAGWSSIYGYHGANTWSATHHRAIAAAKHLSDARILARESLLRRRLAEYDPPLPPVTVPCGVGPIVGGVAMTGSELFLARRIASTRESITSLTPCTAARSPRTSTRRARSTRA